MIPNIQFYKLGSKSIFKIEIQPNLFYCWKNLVMQTNNKSAVTYKVVDFHLCDDNRQYLLPGVIWCGDNKR